MLPAAIRDLHLLFVDEEPEIAFIQSNAVNNQTGIGIFVFKDNINRLIREELVFCFGAQILKVKEAL